MALIPASAAPRRSKSLSLYGLTISSSSASLARPPLLRGGRVLAWLLHSGQGHPLQSRRREEALRPDLRRDHLDGDRAGLGQEVPGLPVPRRHPGIRGIRVEITPPATADSGGTRFADFRKPVTGRGRPAGGTLFAGKRPRKNNFPFSTPRSTWGTGCSSGGAVYRVHETVVQTSARHRS